MAHVDDSNFTYSDNKYPSDGDLVGFYLLLAFKDTIQTGLPRVVGGNIIAPGDWHDSLLCLFG